MDPRRLSVGAQLYRLSTLGITVAVCVFLGLGAGVLLQKWFGWGDWVVLTGIVVGVLSGFAEMLRELMGLKAPKDNPK